MSVPPSHPARARGCAAGVHRRPAAALGTWDRHQTRDWLALVPAHPARWHRSDAAAADRRGARLPAWLDSSRHAGSARQTTKQTGKGSVRHEHSQAGARGWHAVQGKHPDAKPFGFSSPALRHPAIPHHRGHMPHGRRTRALLRRLIAKEATDNALDACDRTNMPGKASIDSDLAHGVDRYTVTDQGGGIDGRCGGARRSVLDRPRHAVRQVTGAWQRAVFSVMACACCAPLWRCRAARSRSRHAVGAPYCGRCDLA